jgi:prophage regulatory protein
MVLLDYDDLRARGIPYSRVHIWRLERAGDFPKRVPIGRARHGWLETEIDAWIKAKIAARDATRDAA